VEFGRQFSVRTILRGLAFQSCVWVEVEILCFDNSMQHPESRFWNWSCATDMEATRGGLQHKVSFATMDSLVNYDSSSDGDNEGTSATNDGERNQGALPVSQEDIKQNRKRRKEVVEAAPSVSLLASRYASGSNAAVSTTTLAVLSSNNESVQDAVGNRTNTKNKKNTGQLIMLNNPSRDESIMFQPVQGPLQTDSKDVSMAPTVVDEYNFSQQRTAFQRTGQALAPTDTGEVVYRTTLGYTSQRLEQFAKDEAERNDRTRKRPLQKDDVLVYGSDDEVEYGVWGPPSREEMWIKEQQMTDLQKVGGNVSELAPEQQAEIEYQREKARQLGLVEEAREDDQSSVDRLLERKMSHLLPPQVNANDEPPAVSTTFHGEQEFDYQGRSWMAAPPGLGILTHTGDTDSTRKCYVPKKCVHRFTGHNKGVHRIRLFPVTGHLLLSAGLDGKCKVWSVVHKQVMRTYIGHAAAVRDVQFNSSGAKFVSASFDRYLRLWDTESGAVLQTFTNRKVPYCVQFYPLDDNYFVVGCSDNKIVTYHCGTGEITQEYNHHLAPVNAVVFVEDHGIKMVSSSDDKKILVWEWDIGVPIKIIR
jgi:WD domain, G-beta repeat